MNHPDETEALLRRAMHAEADATGVSPDALARIRARAVPAKRRGFAPFLRPAVAGSALVFTLVVGTLAGVKIGHGNDDQAGPPATALINPAGTSAPAGTDPGAPSAAPSAKEVLPGFVEETPGTDGSVSSLAGPDVVKRVHQIPADAGGTYVAITSPDSGATVGRAVSLGGRARVFEATVTIVVSQNGKEVLRDFATASAGAPELGDWTKVITLQPGNYRIDAFEESASGDGTRLGTDTIWITVAGPADGATGGGTDPGTGTAGPGGQTGGSYDGSGEPGYKPEYSDPGSTTGTPAATAPPAAGDANAAGAPDAATDAGSFAGAETAAQGPAAPGRTG